MTLTRIATTGTAATPARIAPTNGMNAARNVNNATGMTSELPAIHTARAITTASITPR